MYLHSMLGIYYKFLVFLMEILMLEGLKIKRFLGILVLAETGAFSC